MLPQMSQKGVRDANAQLLLAARVPRAAPHARPGNGNLGKKGRKEGLRKARLKRAEVEDHAEHKFLDLTWG